MDQRAGVSRTRWAAFGAAVAIAVGGGGVAVTHAVVGSGERAVFVSITPCRLFDMRPSPDTVGSRSTPMTPAETVTQPVTGTNGMCTIPADATGVAMNVTAVGGTAPSFLTIWPADADQPLASNLNWVPGTPPTPNKVDVRLSSDGRINLFNNAGTVSVFADVVGYYVDHHHDDRYYRKSQSDAQLAGKANAADVYTKSDVDALPASSMFASGGVNRDGSVTDGIPRFGSWTVSRTDEGEYSIVFPALNPGCTNAHFPLVILTTFDVAGRIVNYDSAGTLCLTGDVEVSVQATDADGAPADTRFQFIAFLPEAVPVIPSGTP